MDNKLKIFTSKNFKHLNCCKAIYRHHMPDGSGLSNELIREVVRPPDFSAVLAYDQNKDSFILVRQHRAGVMLSRSNDECFTVEVISGSIDQGEDARAAAIREFHEETGLILKDDENLIDLNSSYTSPGISTEKGYLFLAFVDIDEMLKGNPSATSELQGSLVENEYISVQIISREEVLKMLCNGELNDMKTVLLISFSLFEISERLDLVGP